MEKYVSPKANTYVNHLREIVNPETKVSRAIIEPHSAEISTNTTKKKLDPLESTFFSSRLPEPITPPYATKSIPMKKFVKNGTLTTKTLYATNKVWGTALDPEATPKDRDEKTERKSKFATNLMSAMEHSKQFIEPLSETITSKVIDIGETFTSAARISVNNHGISQHRSGAETTSSISQSEPKLHTLRNVSMPTFKTHRKVVDKGITLKQNKMEEPQYGKDLRKQPCRLDPCASYPYRHLIFGPIVEPETFKKYMTMVHRGLLYATKNLKSPSEKFIRSKQVYFPDLLPNKTKTLLLDLDETLIHSCMLRNKPEAILAYQAPGEPARQLPIKVRPYLKEFLTKVSPLYEVAVFTASAPCYAKAIVDYIDKDRKIIQTVLTRDNCMETKNGFFIKDLRIIANRELKNIIIVDNLVHSFGFQIENGIPILEFFDDKDDEELRHIANYLVEAHSSEDVRDFNKDKLRLIELANMKLEDIFNNFAGL